MGGGVREEEECCVRKNVCSYFSIFTDNFKTLLMVNLGQKTAVFGC